MQEAAKELIRYQQALAVKEKELKKHRQAIERLYEMREEDSFDKMTCSMPSLDKLKQKGFSIT